MLVDHLRNVLGIGAPADDQRPTGQERRMAEDLLADVVDHRQVGADAQVRLDPQTTRQGQRKRVRSQVAAVVRDEHALGRRGRT